MDATTTEKRPVDRLTHEHIDTLTALAEVRRHDEITEMANPLQGMGSAAVGMGKPRIEHPPIGAVVMYRARTRDYVLPAIVTATVDSLDRRGVVRGDVPDITGEEHVHLNVMSCGPSLCYQEFDIPYSSHPEPGTWGWA